MTDSMKFGPEWIRTLSESGPVGISGPQSHSSINSQHHTTPSSPISCSAQSVRYTLAEHRYGREEMLALYSSSLAPPESLKSLTGLFVDKSQQPLALFSLSDDELRIWNRGVNPDGQGRGGTNKGQTDGSMRGRRDGPSGRGGRGRGSSTPGNYYPRVPGSQQPYPTGDTGETTSEALQPPFARNRPTFERQGDRSWSERNGAGDGTGRRDMNWRRHRNDDSESRDDCIPTSGPSGAPPGGLQQSNNNPGWRPQSKWHNQGRSWRDEDSWTDRDPRMSNHHLPEWAMEKNEGGGSFDASGAFHGHDQDDDIIFNRRDSKHHQKSKSESSDLGDGGGMSDSSLDRNHDHISNQSSSDHDSHLIRNENQSRDKRDDHQIRDIREDHQNRDKKEDHLNKREDHQNRDKRDDHQNRDKRDDHQIRDKRDDQSRKDDRDKNDDAQDPALCLDVLKKHVEKLLNSDQQISELSEIKRQLDLLQKQQEQAATSSVNNQQSANNKQTANLQSESNNVNEISQDRQISMPENESDMNHVMKSAVPIHHSSSPQPQQCQIINQSNLLLNQPQTITSHNILNATGVMQVQMPSQGLQPVSSPVDIHQSQLSPVAHQPLNSLARLHQSNSQQLAHDINLDDHVDNIATDLVSKLMEDEEKRDKQWYYKDPQQQIQGPFSCGEMAEWFQSGYFTLGLMVKRACDPTFSPLGELIKIWGCIPFLADQPGGGQNIVPANIQEKELNHPPQPGQVQGPIPVQPPAQPQPGPQNQHEYIMQMQYRQQQLLLRQQQQQAAMAGRNQVKIPPSNDWPDHLPPQQENQGNNVSGAGGQQASIQLRALLHQMQVQQQMKQQLQSTKVKEGVSPNTGGGTSGVAVMETLMSLHQQQIAQQAALQQLQQAAHLAEQQQHVQHNTSGTAPTAAASIRSIVSQMQQGKIRMNNQLPNVESVWNGSSSWKQWAQVNPKAFKTEQQVLEEQMRAEDERKRDDIRKQEENVRLSEEDTKENNSKRDKQDEKQHNERNKRDSQELDRRRMEEEQVRRKQEAARRTEVERQRKEEEKRKKEEDKRKQQEERERLLMEQERKKKEAEEAMKRQDLMSKIQRSQWCPPQASNTSLLDIQRSEREQMLRTMREQQESAQSQQAQNQMKSNMNLKWTESNKNHSFMAESLAEIQVQQYRQLLKMQEKEKAEREKKEAAAVAASVVNQVGGTWSQGLNWGALPSQAPVWHSNQGGGGSVGFWDQLTSSKHVQGGGTTPSNIINKSNNKSNEHHQHVDIVKENKSKSKREEIAVMQLFNNQRQDEFTQWCQQALSTLTMSCPVDIPTFISFLRDIESGPDVIEYVRSYVGESKEATEFARSFLDKRHSLSMQHQSLAASNQQRQDHILHQQNEDFQQVKAKGKNKKKGRVTKAVDPRILGFSSTASPDRFNVGDREYPEDI